MAGVVKSITCSSGLVTAASGGMVALGDLANVTASRLLGRGSSGGSGSPQEISCGSTLEISGTTIGVAAASITGTHIMDATISDTEMANNSIATAAIQAGAVTLAKLGSDVLSRMWMGV